MHALGGDQDTFVGVEVDEMGTTTLDIRAQTRAVIENIRDVLGAVGARLQDAVQLTTYLVSMNDYPYPLGERPAGAVVRTSEHLDTVTRHKIYRGNAERFLDRNLRNGEQK
ncbi:RidA family protein [Lentzea kentuckyensis]|uniref:RidA family protein n=1 Tax=Lentzea kentuckyensis TaxID=360086 RepID=UPI001FE45708|nr:Rid family hydrolase [Lentzea kentuckyensis]